MNINSNPHSVNRFVWRSAVRLLLWAAALPLGISISSCAADTVPLAINGHDPVAYFTLGEPRPGLPEIEHEWNGYRFRFASAEHRDLFKADPVHYAPQFENFCAMALSKGELVEANPENWLISDGKLYVFGKPVGPALFQKDLPGNILRANQNRTLIPRR
jgi:hypothetical protein